MRQLPVSLRKNLGALKKNLRRFRLGSIWIYKTIWNTLEFLHTFPDDMQTVQLLERSIYEMFVKVGVLYSLIFSKGIHLFPNHDYLK
ncbi:MAG: hypothetical protein A2494_03560 [Candidatus Lloydbacteria bacterium RIFOXYC12_FULL_46_25]|uniref:Uncharacterized protein n=1 Tax=Candidatus Lloydbacteria bacterium RIFOXYC12_FULL_46_25 TaxID=1798670 RepID=A0A1G2DZJ7_9BACT|nr:MAG: hypothetical protein A2494_03560 [Candidatus Lloydbacteria bacterium RIFOXYC12_FULL_46_25]